LAVNHQADIIRAYFGSGEKWGLKIDYSLESMPLGTMGPLRLIADLPPNFLVMNGDILADLNYDEFLGNHGSQGALFTIGAKRRQFEIEYGVLGISEDGFLSGFDEKPKHEFLVSMGIYSVNRLALEWIPENRAFGFDHLMRALLESKKKVSVHEHRGYWLDIGRPEDYQRASDEFEELSKRLFK
jgi:NDP-mannose synthase